LFFEKQTTHATKPINLSRVLDIDPNNT